MIILVLHLLRLLPFLFGGHRQLALENLACANNPPPSTNERSSGRTYIAVIASSGLGWPSHASSSSYTGGQILVTSEVGVGSTFTFRIPVHTGA